MEKKTNVINMQLINSFYKLYFLVVHSIIGILKSGSMLLTVINRFVNWLGIDKKKLISIEKCYKQEKLVSTTVVNSLICERVAQA